MSDGEKVVSISGAAPRSSGGGSGDDGFGERLARIETKMEYIATREDIANIKVLIERKETISLRWQLGILSTAAISLVIVIIRTFLK